MSDEDALLAAIDANPEEDTPRLVYADWLDEQGQSIRAEFIRVEIAVKQFADLPTAEHARDIRLFRRRQELLDHLVGPLATDLGYFDVAFAVWRCHTPDDACATATAWLREPPDPNSIGHYQSTAISKSVESLLFFLLHLLLERGHVVGDEPEGVAERVGWMPTREPSGEE
jgi:uncharacterized protein (TIGR02996 family)